MQDLYLKDTNPCRYYQINQTLIYLLIGHWVVIQGRLTIEYVESRKLYYLCLQIKKENTEVLDKKFGQMVLRFNPKAKRLVFRFKDNVLHITVGNGYAEELIQKAIHSNREKLRALYEKEEHIPKRLFDLSYEIQTSLFSFRIVEESCTQFALRASIGKLILVW